MITKSDIVEIWRVVISCGTKSHYVILISDGSHRCTCNLLITHGYPCRHFYKILRTSSNTKWHIGLVYQLYLYYNMTNPLGISLFYNKTFFRLISSHWYKDDKIISNDVMEQAPISLCSDTSNNETINNIGVFDLGHVKKIRGDKLYTSNLQELNNNRIKYGRAHGMMKKAINLALVTDSYEELIGICQDFLASKQAILDNQNQDKEALDVKNLIITVRKGRPAGRMKAAVEIQDKENTRPGREIRLDNNKENKDNRKKCHNCGQKGHNRATCKFAG
jgi:hypothetical protein